MIDNELKNFRYVIEEFKNRGFDMRVEIFFENALIKIKKDDNVLIKELPLYDKDFMGGYLCGILESYEKWCNKK